MRRMRRAAKARTLPCAGIIQIRFKGYFSPARTECDGTTQDPRVSIAEDTPGGPRLATAQTGVPAASFGFGRRARLTLGRRVARIGRALRRSSPMSPTVA